MGQWFTYVPPWFFSLGRYVYLEEVLGVTAIILLSTLGWILGAEIPRLDDFSVSVWVLLALFLFFLCVKLILVPTFWPRVSEIWNANAKIQELPSNPFSAQPEICRVDLSIDAEGAFRDRDGRRVFLRGVNLSGSTKLPPGVTTRDEAKIASFVGKPFPLDQADDHLNRLRSAGFSFLRLLVTWEAVEPEAKGKYDAAYLSYVKQVVQACGKHGISVVIDPHQDVWSRWTGGDGAPRWTLDQLGFDVDNFWACRAAILHSQCPDLPKMGWTTNYMLYACATMFSLFFAGNDLVQNKVEGEPVQDWLQNAFIKAMVEVAKAVKDEPNVLGFEAMNEPNAGWVGRCSSQRPLTEYDAGLPLGWLISPWDAVLCANGQELQVPVFSAPMVYSHTETVNPEHKTVWKAGVRDIWAENGLWDDNTHTLLQPDFFRIPDAPAEEPFQERYMVPFWRKFGEAIHRVMPDALIFTSPTVELEAPGSHQPGQVLFPGKQVWAPHWYDGLTLMNGRFRSWLGVEGKGLALWPWAQGARRRGVEAVLSAKQRMPSLLGETGVPWMGAGGMTGEAMEATMKAIEEANPDAVTLWNYTPDHDGRDDGWNNEDLSLWSQGLWRMPEAIRPHVKRLAAGASSAVAALEPSRRVFKLSFEGGRAGSVSEIFVPYVHYPSGVRVQVSDGDSAEFNEELQTVFVTAGGAVARHEVEIAPQEEASSWGWSFGLGRSEYKRLA